jgi:cytochrome b561
MRYTLKFRIWHWLNAFVVLGLLGTVFLRKTFLSWRANSEILMEKLLEFHITISSDQAKILAKAIRAEMWEWHIYLGYALAFLMIYRTCLYFKDSSFRQNFLELDLHKKGVKSLYILVYSALFFMTFSGFVIYFYQELGLSKDIAHNIKEIHEAVYIILLVSVPLHIVGVVFADATQERGIISRMIHGRDIES